MAAIAAGAFRPLPYFLPVVHQHGTATGRVHQRHDGRQDGTPHAAPGERGAHARFIMVLHIADAVGHVLGVAAEKTVEIVGPVILRVHVERQMVAIGIVNGIEPGFQQRGAGIAGSGLHVVVVRLRHEKHVRQTDAGTGNGPFPEGHGDHLGHVAPETADAQALPEGKDVVHDAPGLGHVLLGAGPVRQQAEGRQSGQEVIAVVELDRFIPVIPGGVPRNGIVARDAAEGHFPFKQAVRQMQGGAVPRAVGGQVKVPLLRREKRMVVVPFPEIVMAVPVRQVGAGNMVGDEVDHRQQSHRPAALHQGLEFLHSFFRRGGQVRVHVKIIHYRIGTAGQAFYDGFRLGGQLGIGRLRGVPQHPGQPDVGKAHPGYFPQGLVRHAVKGAAPVRLPGPPVHPMGFHVGEMADKQLINDRAHELKG